MGKRYIDADALLSDLKNKPFISYTDIIKRQPTADVVEVVRCKDCKHSCRYTKWNGIEYLGCITRYIEVAEVDDMHYCSYGERRKENV